MTLQTYDTLMIVLYSTKRATIISQPIAPKMYMRRTSQAMVLSKRQCRLLIVITQFLLDNKTHRPTADRNATFGETSPTLIAATSFHRSALVKLR